MSAAADVNRAGCSSPLKESSQRIDGAAALPTAPEPAGAWKKQSCSILWKRLTKKINGFFKHLWTDNLNMQYAKSNLKMQWVIWRSSEERSKGIRKTEGIIRVVLWSLIENYSSRLWDKSGTCWSCAFPSQFPWSCCWSAEEVPVHGIVPLKMYLPLLCFSLSSWSWSPWRLTAGCGGGWWVSWRFLAKVKAEAEAGLSRRKRP